MNKHRRVDDRDWWRNVRRDAVQLVVVAVAAFSLAYACAPTFAGGPDPREILPAPDGDCWRATAYPINAQQARLLAERGWRELPFDRRQEIAAAVGAGKAEVILVPDYRVCGRPAGELRLTGAWFWRERGAKRGDRGTGRMIPAKEQRP